MNLPLNLKDNWALLEPKLKATGASQTEIDNMLSAYMLGADLVMCLFSIAKKMPLDEGAALMVELSRELHAHFSRIHAENDLSLGDALEGLAASGMTVIILDVPDEPDEPELPGQNAPSTDTPQ